MSNKILKNVERPYFLMAAGAAVNLAVQLVIDIYFFYLNDLSNLVLVQAWRISQNRHRGVQFSSHVRIHD